MLIEGAVFFPWRQHPGQSRRDRGAMRGGACRPGLASSQVLRSCPKQPHAFLPLGFPFGFEFSAKLCILVFCSECVPQLCCLLVVEEGPLWVPEEATRGTTREMGGNHGLHRESGPLGWEPGAWRVLM